MKILVIAAHPDDEVLGCGGTIAKLASQGDEIHILILANGLTSRIDFNPDQGLGALQIHHDRAKRAGALLGAFNVKIAGLPDQKLDSIPLLDITQIIEAEIENINPEVVFTQHGGDLNMDHAITFRATLTATRPAGRCPVKSVYGYQVPSSTEWAFQSFEPRFQPNVFVDISNTLAKKISAMQVYESETRPFPHPRSPEALEAIARQWGSVAGVNAAEAFHLIRQIK
jgi:LmbE family N-acetylglucosaminyl deacetylase